MSWLHAYFQQAKRFALCKILWGSCGHLHSRRLMICLCILFQILLDQLSVSAQPYRINGVVIDKTTHKPLANAQVLIEPYHTGAITNEEGQFLINNITTPVFSIKVNSMGFMPYHKKIQINDAEAETITIELEPAEWLLDEIIVREEKHTDHFSVAHLKNVEGTAIYAGKKNELILPDLIAANKAANNARQIFAKVPGLHIWESDGAGLQMGVGGRGLSPNRNSNFNVRQNGYDISADALGYPESYYTPPVEAIERIEVIRGAASLQYGPQFGGLVNFVFKKGPENTSFECTTRQTVGSWLFYNNFTSIGGNSNKINYYALYQYKRGNGWRPHSEFTNHTAYGSIAFRMATKATVRAEVTHMNYLAQQPGGLTDAQFAENPRQSLRERNWFRVNWNLLSATIDVNFNARTKLNSRNFSLIAGRDALGILSQINYADLGQPRDLIMDQYINFGNETRLLHRYSIMRLPQTLLTGFRIYRGYTARTQGFASKGSDPDFRFINQDNPGGSDYEFPGFNFAWFAEQVFTVRKNLTITPGIRAEYIYTGARGKYNLTVKDFAENIVSDTLIAEQRNRRRGFLLAGIGISYKPFCFAEVYANFSQNYRSITFSDLRIINPNSKVDPNIQDERGFNADIGIRGNFYDKINYDISIFTLYYDNRIGLILVNDTAAPYLPFRYRTNIGTSLSYGVEAYAELDITRIFNSKIQNFSVGLFGNISAINATYIRSKDKAIENNKVELVPPVTIRSGISTSVYRLKVSLIYSFVKEHFTDATNAIRTATAVNGIIPSYAVMDFSAQYPLKWFQIEAGINNLTNKAYFTRRADAYPGPGIIPSDARNFYLTLQFKIGTNSRAQKSKNNSAASNKMTP
jgi:Fe(3+) dicitrate transport protein